MIIFGFRIIQRWLVCREKTVQGLTDLEMRTRRNGVRAARRWTSNNLHSATLLLTKFRLPIQTRLTKIGRMAVCGFRCSAARPFGRSRNTVPVEGNDFFVTWLANIMYTMQVERSIGGLADVRS
jgi:hypothetical protein